MERLEYFSIFIFFLASDRKWQNILISSYSFIVLVELVVDLDSLGDQAKEVEILHVAGSVVEHPGLAVVVAVVGVAAIVSRKGEISIIRPHCEGWPLLRVGGNEVEDEADHHPSSHDDPGVGQDGGVDC